MNDPSSQEKLDLDELEALAAKATATPWRYVRARTFRRDHVADAGIGALFASDCLIYTTPVDRGCLPETWERQASDGEFIAALVNAFPALLRAAREKDLCQENREKLREAVLRKIEAAETQSRSPDETLSWIGTSRRDAYHEVLALIEEASP